MFRKNRRDQSAKRQQQNQRHHVVHAHRQTGQIKNLARSPNARLQHWIGRRKSFDRVVHAGENGGRVERNAFDLILAAADGQKGVRYVASVTEFGIERLPSIGPDRPSAQKCGWALRCRRSSNPVTTRAGISAARQSVTNVPRSP